MMFKRLVRSLVAFFLPALFSAALALPAAAAQHFSFKNETGFSVWVTFYEAGSGKNAKSFCVLPHEPNKTWYKSSGGNFIKSLLGEARKNSHCQNNGRIWYLRDNNVRGSGDITKTIVERGNGGLAW